MNEVEALSSITGLPLDLYRPGHVQERVRRALERERAADTGALARLLARDATARDRFRRSVAVSVTGHFRDPAQFELLERELLPPLLAHLRGLRVWSAGCADGSEVVSLAIVLERLGALERAFLLGSDVLDENVELARRGAGGLPAGGRVRFERRDVLREPAPPGRWHLILCRNLAIYVGEPAKRALHEKLAGALAHGGVLLLGRSERLADAAVLGLEPAGPHAYRSVA